MNHAAGRGIRFQSFVVTLSSLVFTGPGLAGQATDVEQMLELPIEDLFNLKITTASKISESPDIAPATVYVVTAEQIERLGLRDLKDILALVPGVDLVDPHFFLEGGQRGFMGTFAQTLILVNGREMNNLIAGETFISNQFRSRNIKQVEIIAGPGSALYGANAVAGVINIITKEVDGVELSVSAGSWNSREVNILFGKKTNDFKIQGSASLYKSDGPDFTSYLSNPAKASPKAENNPYRHLPNAYGYDSDEDAIPVSLYAENKGAYAGMEYYRNTTGRGTSGIQWDYTQGEDFRELLLAYAGYKREQLLDGRLDWKAEYRYYWEQFWGNHTESEGPVENPFTGETKTFDATVEDVEEFRGFYSNKRSDGSRKHVGLTEATWRFSDRQTVVGGLQYENADIVGAAWSRTNGVHPPIGSDQQRPEYQNYKTALYLQDQIKLFDRSLTATLGARYEDHERYGGTFIPRGGLVWQPVKQSVVKALYGKSFREPTVFELRNGPDIKPMEMETAELGWHQYLGKYLKNGAVVFKNWAEDVIVSDSTEIGGISNKGELDAEGFEDVISFSYKQIKGFLNYTYTTSELDEPQVGAHDVLDIPKHKASLATYWEFIENYSIGLVLRYRGEVETEYHGDLYTVDDYVVCDLTFNVLKLPWMGVSTRLDFTVKNVFDEEYFDAEPRAPSVLRNPQEERAIFATLTMDI
jgi:outer membrane receptor for ferrienterochelin and colicin